MKSAKKLLLLVLSLVMLVGVFAVAAFAEEAAGAATVVYPDGSTETVAVGSAITPKEFGAQGEAKLYYGANNTLYKDDAAEGWIFTLEGADNALTSLSVTAEMAGKRIIASGADKVYFTTKDADGTVYHTTNTAHSYLTMSGIKKSTDLTLYEDVNAEKFNFLANSSTYTVKLDLNGHTVTVKTKTHAQYVRIYIYSSKAGAHYYCEDGSGIAYATSAYIHFGDDGTGSYVNNVSFHAPIITKGNNYHVYVIGGHYYQTEATSAFLDMTRYLKELKNATFYLYPGTDAVLAADEAFSGAAVKHGDIATGTAAINNCTFYSPDGNIPVLYSTTGATSKFTNCRFYGVAATAAGTSGTVTADETNTVNGAIVYNTVTWYDGTTDTYYATSRDAALAYVQSLPKAKVEIDLGPMPLPSEDGTKMYYFNDPAISLKVDDAFNAVQTVDGEKMTVYFTKTTTDTTTYYYGDLAAVNTELINLLTTPGTKNSELKFYSDFTLTAAAYIRMNMGNVTHKIDLNGYKLTINFTAAVNYALRCEYGALYIYSSREGGVIDSRSSKYFWYTDTSGNFYLGESDTSGTAYGKNFTLICKALNTSRLWSKNGYILGGTYVQPQGTSSTYFFAQGNAGNGNIRIQNATFILNDITTAWMKGGCEHDGVMENVTIIAKNQTALFEPLDNFNKDITFKNCYFYNITPTLIDGATYTYEDCYFNKLYDAQANGILAYTEEVVLTVNGTDYVFNTTVAAAAQVGTVNWGFGITEPWVIGTTATHANVVVDGVFGYKFAPVEVQEGTNKAVAAIAAIKPGTLSMNLALQSSILLNLTVSDALVGATVKIGDADAVAIAKASALKYAIAPNVANLDVAVVITIGENEHEISVNVGDYAKQIASNEAYANAHNLVYAMVDYVRAMTKDNTFCADLELNYEKKTLTAAPSANEGTLLESIAFQLDGTIAIAVQGAGAIGKEVNLVLATGRSERATVGDNGIVIFKDLYVNEFNGEMHLYVDGETYTYSLANYLNGIGESAEVQALYNYAFYAQEYVDTLDKNQ